MNTTSSTPSAAGAAREIRDTRDAEGARPAARERFDDALQRASQRRGSPPQDEDPGAAAPSEIGIAPWFTHPLQADAAAAAASAALALGRGTEPVAAAPTSALPMSAEQFSASLARLQAPLDMTQGVQQWQFTLAEHSLPLASVQLNATAGGPWQMSLQSHGTRDRQLLHAQLDKLRERLRARGAPVSDVRLGDAGDALF